MVQSTSPRPPRKRPPRSVLLTHNVLRLTVGNTSTIYALEPVPADFGIGFCLRKQEGLRDEAGRLVEVAETDVYHVLLDVRGGRHSCECLGFLRWGHCKHCECLAALYVAGRLPVPATVKPVPAPAPVTRHAPEDLRAATNELPDPLPRRSA